MKVLVVSDTHGDIQTLNKILDAERPDAMIHLGDYAGDMEKAKLPPETKEVFILPGNCDYSKRQPEVLAMIGGRLFLMLHGHTRNVKSGYLSAELAARERGAEILLFGHTHIPFSDLHNGLLMMNPGSARARGKIPGSYGVIHFDPDGQGSFSPPEYTLKKVF